MYMIHVKPITSANWDPSSLQKDGLVGTDRLHIGAGGRTFSKAEKAGTHSGILEPAEHHKNQI